MAASSSVTHQTIDRLTPRRVALVVSNPAVSPVSGLPVGFWWSELSQVYWELRQNGYDVDIASPDGGAVRGDAWSDPDNPDGFAGDDLVSRGFKHTPSLMAKLDATPPLSSLDPTTFDALYLIGGQGPVVTFRDHAELQRYTAAFFESGKMLALVCHATCLLLNARVSNGTRLAAGKSWTGSTKLEETLREEYAGRRLYPYYIQDEAAKLAETNYVAVGPFREHAIRDGTLITGQQQYSAVAVARLLVRALGV